LPISKINITNLEVMDWFKQQPEKVDIWITDPPYSFDNQNGSGRMKFEGGTDKMYNRMSYADLKACYSEMLKLSNPGASCYIFTDRDGLFHCKPDMEKVGWTFRQIIVYNKCLGPETPICTNRGIINISDINSGDMVYTPNGTLSRVIGTFSSKKKAMKIYFSDHTNLICSEEHPFYVDGRQTIASELIIGSTLDEARVYIGDQVKKLTLASLITDEDLVIDLPDPKICLFCKEEFPNVRGAAAHQARFCTSAISKKDMAKSLGITRKKLGWWMSSGRLPIVWARELGLDHLASGNVSRKMQNGNIDSFRESIPLDYSWGKLIGLYAAEGYGTANNICFALHKNEKHLQNHIARTVRSLGIKAHIFNEADDIGNGCVVNVCSRVFSDLVRHFVGGNRATNKYILETVYSAPEVFRRGVFDGMIEGDGHWNHDKQLEEYVSSSHDLSLFIFREARFMGYEPIISRFENDFAGGWKVKFDPKKEQKKISIIKIETLEEQLLFDISIDDPEHLYILGNGITTHNCNMGMGYHFRNQIEYIVYCTNGPTKRYVTKIPNIISAKKPKGLSAKPPIIWDTILTHQLRDGDILADPFAGSDPLSKALNGNAGLLAKVKSSYSNIYTGESIDT